MPFPLLARALGLAVALAALPAPAAAQTAACERYRTELSSLDRGGQRIEDAARRQRSELTRLTGYYRSIGCGSARSFFFEEAPEAECSALAQRIRSLQAASDRLAAGDFGESDTGAKRQQLLSAIEQFCRAPDQDARAGWRRGFDDPFGDDQPPARGGIVQEPGRILDESFTDQSRSAGGKRVCVKTCDGSFFPLDNAGRGDADEMCQALCPGTEARAFSMPLGPSALDQAVSVRSGQRYGDLPNAYRFQKKIDASCACKRDGESWAQILQRAESMLERRDGDMVVTAEQAEELSRARVQKRPGPARERASTTSAPAKKPPAKPREASAEPGSAGPAPANAGQTSSSGSPGASPGPARATAKPRYRVVAPGVLPVPGAGTPSAP